MAEGAGLFDSVELNAVDTALTLVSSLDVTSVAGDRLTTLVLSTERLLNAVHALSAELLERFERDGSWATDGALSAAAWTAERTGSAAAGLRGRRRQGAALTLLPNLAAHARDGALSTGHLRAVGDCAGRHPELAAAHEDLWVEQTDALGAEAFGTAARHWLAAADDHTADHPADGPVQAEPVSRVHGSRTLDGWLHVDAMIAPDVADIVDAALDAGVDRLLRAARDGDPSVAGQPVSVLRAAVLVDLAAQSMRHEPSDASVPDRYRVAVLVQPGEATVPAEAACDAVAYRVALGAAGEVLDVGRQTNRWPVAIRRAITVRDGGCCFPGCDRPPSWTDIHHCTPWSEGGDTSVDNGALLCRRHHGFIHRQRWQITLDGGRPTARRPDGTPHTITRWQHPDTEAS